MSVSTSAILGVRVSESECHDLKRKKTEARVSGFKRERKSKREQDTEDVYYCLSA